VATDNFLTATELKVRTYQNSKTQFHLLLWKVPELVVGVNWNSGDHVDAGATLAPQLLS
jgi:hypothetical protein